VTIQQNKAKESTMMTKPVELTVIIQSADGSSAEFCQRDAQRVNKCLRLLAAPRLFSEPQLFLASASQASAFRAPAIDVILARTSAPLPRILPMRSPAGSLDVSEAEEQTAVIETRPGVNADEMNSRTFRVELQMLGGWSNTLELRVQVRGTVSDRRHTAATIFRVPVIPFRLRTGGIGFINPNNIIRATFHPAPDSLPETALPMVLVRSAPLAARLNRKTR
jgi:hypothetical protein